MGYGCNYQAHITKSVTKGGVVADTVHERKVVFYKPYLEKWLCKLL